MDGWAPHVFIRAKSGIVGRVKGQMVFSCYITSMNIISNIYEFVVFAAFILYLSVYQLEDILFQAFGGPPVSMQAINMIHFKNLFNI